MARIPADGSAVSGPSSEDLPRAGIKGIAWIALQTSVTNFASLAVFIVLSRLLEPKAFGLVASASVVVLFFRILVDAGISKKLVQRADLTQDVVDTAFWAAVASGTILALAIVAAAPLVARLFHEPLLTNIVRALSCVLVFASLDRTQSALLDRRMAFRVQAARSIAAAVCSTVAAIWAALAGWGVWALVVQSISFEVVNLVLLWSLSGWFPSFRFSRRHLAELLSFGARYTGIAVMQYLDLNCDNFLIGVFLGPVALGFYVVAYRVLIVLNEAMVMTVSRVGLAAFSRLQIDQVELQKSAYDVAAITAVMTLPIYAGLVVLAPQAVHILFGPKWASAAIVMQILCVAGMMQTITSFTHPLLIASGKVHNELRWNVGACVLEVAGFGAAVHFGIVAVAWSLAIASTILLPLRMTFMQRWVGISMRSYFARLLGPVAATVVMVVVVLLLSYWLSGQELILRVISEIAAGGVCYILCLVVLDRKTARLLVQVLRSLRQ